MGDFFDSEKLLICLGLFGGKMSGNDGIKFGARVSQGSSCPFSGA